MRSFIGNYGFFLRYRPLRLSAQRARGLHPFGHRLRDHGHLRRLSPHGLSGGITHASFGGLGIAFYLGLNPIAGALVFAVLSALGIEWAGNRGRIREDSAIGIIWSVGMALGVLFMSLRPGYTSGDLAGYLFGSIVTVSGADVAALAALTSEDREIFLRRYYYNQTAGQIAEALHMNPSTVRSRLLRGRQSLRTELQKGDVQIEDLCAESV